MVEKKIKILGIAPYQSLKTSMTVLAASYENIELVTYVGNLNAGAELVTQFMDHDFDVIISRGGTASLIKTISTIPVVEIPLSVYDILRTIKLAAASTGSYAVIGYPNITTPAELLCDLLHYDLKITTIHHENEVTPALRELKEQGYQFVLCDVVTEILARTIGINPILIVSGTESIQNAFEQALQICSHSSSLQKRNSLLEAALQKQPANTIILNRDGTVLFSTYHSENISIVMDYLKTLINEPQKNTSSKSFHLIDNALYSVAMDCFPLEDSSVYLFCVEPNPIPPGSSKYGLRFTSYADMTDMYSNSFYSLTSSSKMLEEQVLQLAQTNVPVMILGESGTGKNQVAAKLYLESPQKNNPYIIIDCPLINERNWNFLTKHYNSPLCDKNNTIFISNIQALSQIRQQQLLSLIMDINTHKRNRILFSCSQSLDENVTDPSEFFINYLPCTTIFLPPLRELTDDIPSSSSLYLNNMNVDLPKQIVGFEPEALSLLCDYHWPDNFMQLKRVLTDLVLLTSTQYIQADTVQQVLEKEKRQYAPQAYDSFNYNRPLDAMLHDIVRVVVAKCNGNQTKAAKQLGIGRTTLWRYLNSDE